MPLPRPSIPLLLPLLALLVTLAALPVACSDSECTNGTVRMDIAVPSTAAAAAVDVAFEVAGQVVHSQRLPITDGASSVSADIVLPGGYPAGQNVVVTAVAKRLEAGKEVPVATWFAAQIFPKGCIGFVVSLFPTNMGDGGGSDAIFSFPDAGPIDANPAVDGATPDASGDARQGDGADVDGATQDAAGTADADVDAPVV